ncbi:hypothetical protein SLG_05730 [Sphingobium sp. SYK-6]|uniref:SPOR domain-containing protein n=1 Tax=Sphingobium sp. (strain NBRC 103272 / SYK-6) TaxID=627192 RepID=UPI00022767D8|nr:SPOR domain-containing protein [Sphingobium sp. SYK-6]BAK65248.1 hypothetical protein SLG_05730 [Sphingobium sp. SYK-6]
MTAEQGDGFNLDDRDRLPWLEPAGAEEEPERASSAKVIGLVLAGLVLLGAIVGGGYWLKNRNGAAGGTEEARLIQSEGQSFKIPANASDAREFDGEGDAAFDASEGGEAAGRIDASKAPEAPRTDLKAAIEPTTPPARPAAGKPNVTAPVKTVSVASKKPATTAASASDGTPRIQLGAFGSKEIAEGVWKKLSGRFEYLTPLGHSVEPVETGGKTLYRLRVPMASVAEAGTTCGKLRVAGENCMVVR